MPGHELWTRVPMLGSPASSSARRPLAASRVESDAVELARDTHVVAHRGDHDPRLGQTQRPLEDLRPGRVREAESLARLDEEPDSEVACECGRPGTAREDDGFRSNHPVARLDRIDAVRAVEPDDGRSLLDAGAVRPGEAGDRGHELARIEMCV